MARYESEEKTLAASAEKVFDKLDNLEGLRELLERVPKDTVPEDKRALLENIEITPDSITIPGGPVGTVKLRKIRSISPELIELQGEGTPVPVSLSLSLKPEGPESCIAKAVIEIGIPAIAEMMISGPMKKMASQFGDVLGALKFE